MRWTIKAKTILGVALIEVTLLTALIVTGLNLFRDYNQQRLEIETELIGRLFTQAASDAVISYDLATLESLINALDEPVTRVKVVTPDGIVLAQSLGFDDSPFAISEQGVDLDSDEFTFEVPIVASNTEFGRAQIGIDVSDFALTLANASRGAIAIALAEIALVAMFSFLLGSYITRQLSSLGEAANKVKDGDYQIRIERYTNDEVGEVAMAFNRMAERLENARVETLRYQSKLEVANKSLEARVAERTASLENANHVLQETADNLRKAQSVMTRQETLASVGTLAAGMAHEINTPLGFVLSNHSVLAEYVHELIAGEGSAQDIIQDIEAITKENVQGLKRIDEIIKSLKTLVHDGEVEYKALALDELTQKVLLLVRHRLGANVQIDNSVLTDCFVEGDETRLIQVLTNLVINAGQAMAQQGELKLYVTSKADTWRLHVCDNGSGIAPENLEHIFEPFFTTKSLGEGTGLGLSISYGIVKDHGGDLEVKSVVGEGTQFIVVLPKASKENAKNA